MSYQSITVRPVAGSLGAEISGVDLAAPLSNTAAAEIRRAFVENLVLFFRDQRPDAGAASGLQPALRPALPHALYQAFG